jgi:hypothetical protein
MSNALDASDYIYQGCWINWTKGRLLGSTLTLTSTNSTLLTNMLALFVTMAGGQFWTILRFTLHQLRASHNSDRQLNILYHKEQVVLRNTTSALTTAQLLLTLRWDSRRSASRAPTHNMPVIVLAILSAAFFFVAGAFSNTMTNAGPQVLSRSPFCGFWNQTYFDIAQNGLDAAMGSVQNLMLANEANAKRDQDTELSLQYAQGCYLGQSTESSNCDTFQTSALSMTITNESTCPFSAEICRSDVDTIVFDTGPINTHTDLGINAAPSDRLSFRRVTKCTVLDNTNLTTGWINQSTLLPNSTQPTWQIASADFGPSLLWDKNETYTYSNFADFYTNFAGDWSKAYQLGFDYVCATNSAPSQCYSSFAPIPDLASSLSNADIVLLYLSFTGTYIDPVSDPWFSAHIPYHLNTSVPFLQTTYARDKPISALACTEQHQYCANPQTCTPLLGYSQAAQHLTSFIPMTPNQNITLNRLLSAVTAASLLEIADTFTAFSVPLLAGSKTLSESHTISLPLPSDQWKAELAYWQSISLAQLQRSMILYGTGQIAARPEYLLKPSTEAERWLCENLMIRSTVFQNFSVCALGALLGIGLVVIGLSLWIEGVAEWVDKRFGRRTKRLEGEGAVTGLEWKDHDMLGEQAWRGRIARAEAGSEVEEVADGRDRLSTTMPMPMRSLSQDTIPPPYSDGKEEVGVRIEQHSSLQPSRGISSQPLSREECERLGVERAYGLWI